MTMVGGKIRPWVPGNTFLQTVSLPAINGASPFIAQNPLPDLMGLLHIVVL